jgi:nucleoside-diphosphate-sugar epimerase
VTQSILVTGAAGFLGWNMTRALRRRFPGAEIVGLDNLWTGRRRKPEYVDHMIIGDVADVRTTSRNFYDTVLHLASPASPKHYQTWPLRTIDANVLGLKNCLQWMKPMGTIFFSSSSEVYGDPVVSPQSESYVGMVNCLGPRACYDESKRLCETILTDHRRLYGTRIRIARYFNVYGPGTLIDDGRAVSNFITYGLQKKNIEVYGSGAQTRCFTYVDDVVDGTLRLIFDTEYCGPLNIGIDRETPVLEIAQHVRDIMHNLGHRSVRIQHVDAAVDDPRQRRPDLTLARKIIDWNPTTRYEVGIAQTTEYFMSEMKIGA